MGYWDRLRWIDRFARCDTYKEEKPIIKHGKTSGHEIQASDMRNLRKEKTKCLCSQEPMARREEVGKDRFLVSEVQRVQKCLKCGKQLNMGKRIRYCQPCLWNDKQEVKRIVNKINKRVQGVSPHD